MNIGDVAKASNLPTKTIRYYEDIGLIAPNRQDNGYRDFDGEQLHKLRFLQRSRSLGFSVEDCRILLALYDDKTRPSSDVKAIAAKHLTQIERKLAELESIKATLHTLIEGCAGDHRPDCPILEDLARLQASGQ
ncbi:MAG: Cu(I)-responsive transcriptional regulator [Rhizobiales bacterium]|nr:Cu(I)-responsive transcriptional regulator [Hyphomicrobiales bacterium]